MKKKSLYTNYQIFKFLILSLCLYLINYYVLKGYFKNPKTEGIVSIVDKDIKKFFIDFVNKTKTNLSDEFFQLSEVKEQMYIKNLTSIETITGGIGNIGNALIMLNNLINICENIKCRNIIIPGGGLEQIIKNPIFYRDYNITIFPKIYENKFKIDITLSNDFIFQYTYKKKTNYNRLDILREEILKNIPQFISSSDDLYINIRSGDIFGKNIFKYYAQPPLCFYKKIINENNFSNIYLVSNGHENPVVDELFNLYPKIKYIHKSILGDISIIINAHNFVISKSTFAWTLIYLNNNLEKLYIYKFGKHHPFQLNCIIYEMESSLNYKNRMQRKWYNVKEQLDLMISENCYETKLKPFISFKQSFKNFNNFASIFNDCCQI